MNLRCKPGDLAVIVAEEPGCEENIGAFVTVLAADPEAPQATWGFTKASRPLTMIDEDDGSVSYVTESDQPDCVCWIYDCHLQPIRPGKANDGIVTRSPVPAELEPA